MYGLVNKAIEDMVRRDHGDETWERVRAEAGVKTPAFLSTADYEDRVTYDLVAAASRLLEIDPGALLADFGKFWVLETAPKGYSDLLDAAGSDMRTFLLNLPDLHSRIMLILPNLKPPEFDIVEMGEHEAVLSYRSHRPGLQPFVVGLFHGLGQRFGHQVKVSTEKWGNEEGEPYHFLVSWV